MGFKTTLIGVGPDVPRIDMMQHAEGGPGPAAEAIARLLPSVLVAPLDVTTLNAAAHPGDKAFGIATFGPTTILAGDLAFDHVDELRARARDTALMVWTLQIHSVVDLCAFDVTDSSGTLLRSVHLYADMDPDISRAVSGEPLPFEVPYWAGAHDDWLDEEEEDEPHDYPLTFHPLELGEAAIAWMFATSGEGAPEDDVQRTLPDLLDLWTIPAHRFAVMAATQTLASVAPSEGKSSWSIFRRRR